MSIKQLTIDFLKLFGVFLIMIVLFFSLTVLTYLLPKDKIKHNAAFAVTNFNAEKASYAKYSPFFEVDGALHDSVKLDNYTDTLILGVAVANIDENLNIFEKAIYNFKYKEASVGAEKRYEQIFTENRKADAEYIRYWFGNLTVIKPLLVFLSYQSIRYLNMLLIFTLLFFAVYLIAKKINIKYALAYFISMLLCQIFIIPMSLQFTPVFLITLISSIVILLLYKKKYFNKLLPYMFLLIGGLTAFFDLLTVPLLTFGFPMILVMLLRNKYEKCTFKENLLLLIKLGAIWCVSYGMTYLAKWIIASIILGQNEIANAWEQFLFRTNADNEYNNRCDQLATSAILTIQ